MRRSARAVRWHLVHAARGPVVWRETWAKGAVSWSGTERDGVKQIDARAWRRTSGASEALPPLAYGGGAMTAKEGRKKAPFERAGFSNVVHKF